MDGRNRSIAALLVPTLVLCFAGSVGAAPARSSVVLHVDAKADSGGNGTANAPYRNIPESVAEARARILAGAARVKIQIAPGFYLLGETLVLDVPGVELRAGT